MKPLSLLCIGALAGLLAAPAAWAQAPAWQAAATVAVATSAAPVSNFSSIVATAVDAVGNVYVVGNFKYEVVVGGTTLISDGGYDVFVAKFSPITNQFVWVQQAGGTGDDQASALAVSGSNVYVTGVFSGTARFGPTTLTPVGITDMFVAKLTDAGSTGSFVWAQKAGGTGNDSPRALAASGNSVYVAGEFSSPTVSFGASTLTNTGDNDAFVAKLTDAGSTSSFTWALWAGGTRFDVAKALAVSGSSVYVAGDFFSPAAAFGLTSLATAGGYDVFVAKLLDAGSTASFAWAQRAGGTGFDQTAALAISGGNVYVAGEFTSATLDFGPTTLTNARASNADMFVAKLTDAGSTSSFTWAQRAGGTYIDRATALAVRGSSVYVAGDYNSSTADFGTTTLANALLGTNNLFVTKLTDAGSTGSFAWAQRAVGSGTIGIRSGALALSGTSIYTAGSFHGPTLAFGSTTLTNPYPGPPVFLAYLAGLTDPTLTATAASRALAPAALWPNPARGTATLRLPVGTAPAPLILSDALGRAVRHYPAPTGPEVALDLRGLPAGLYLLRGAGPATRLVVE